jgi:hypothetical protein
MADTEIIASRLKPENKYGQNGYQGPSSDTPGEHTTSGFLPQAAAPDSGGQTRQLRGGNADPDNVPIHSASRSRNGEGGTVPKSTDYRKQ